MPFLGNMDTVENNTDTPAVIQELTEDKVLSWLKQRNYTQAYNTLKNEIETCRETNRHHTGQLSTPDSSANPSSTVVAELGSSVEEALSAYRQLAGEGSVYALLEHWDPQFLSTCNFHRSQGESGLECCDAEKRIEELQDSNNHLRARERELDTQLKQTVTIIAERLQALVTSVDPMRKDILLPLLRTVAVLGSSSSVRAAARHMMLTLYKRPIVEHRLAIAQEWLRIAHGATSRSLEQELIPELYSLVNAQVFERRLLALDCAAAVAPLLRQSPQVRYSLCQGLLRPLCEDEASAVRRELPRCLSLMWGGAGATDMESVGGGVTGTNSNKSLAGTAAPSTAAAASDSMQPAARETTIALSPSQQAFVMELLVHLATDTNSRTVRLAAQTQLCEVLYPVFLRDNVLLTQFVPLLLTVISMEVSQMLLQWKPTARGSGGTAATTNGTAAGGGASVCVGGSRNSNFTAGGGASAAATVSVSGRDESGEATATLASALSLNNVMTLVQLLHAALRCVAAEVVHSREADDRRSGAHHSTASAIATSITNTYLHVVLPSAHNLLVPLLSKIRFTPASAREEVGGSGCGGVYYPNAQLCGVLCALCAALASLVPLLGALAWDGVTRFIKASVLTPPGLHVDALTGLGAPSSSSSPAFAPAAAHDTSQNPQEILPGRLLFACSYFLFLSGHAVTFSEKTELAPGCTETAPTTSTKHREGGADCSMHPALVTKQIQQDSFNFLAHQIRLESDNLTGPRSTALTTCVQCIAALAPFAQESHEVSSGIKKFVRFLAGSTDARLRLTAVVLVHDGCAAIAHERLRVVLLIEPLLPLLVDPQSTVQEAALTGILSVAIALTEPRAQEKTIRPILRVADTAGCTSRFTRCMLIQCDHLMKCMPAEPREALLYPQLAALMDRLAEQYVQRVSREGMGQQTPSAAAASASFGGPPHGYSTSADNGGAGTRAAAGASYLPVAPRESLESSVEQWEGTMLILQALLHNILRCAVVTPTLVSRYLLPGIQQLASEGVLSACSSNLRTRWHRLLESYRVFLENNTSRLPSFAANPYAANLLDRVKDELKRRL